MRSTEKNSWTIDEKSWDLMVAHGTDGYPDEICGVLLFPEGLPGRITEVYPVENVTNEDAANRYLVSPEELLKVQKQAENEGLDICGFYHTHPDSPPLPSETDRKTAWEGYLYLILSVEKGKFEEARAWEYSADDEQFLEIDFNHG